MYEQPNIAQVAHLGPITNPGPCLPCAKLVPDYVKRNKKL